MTIRWLAFELRPEPVELLDPRGEYLNAAWRDHVYPLAARLGLPLKQPPVQARSRLAHEAAKWAAEYGNFEQYNLGVFRAFFEFGLDIGKIEVLRNIAEQLGMDGAALAAALEEKKFTAAVLADEEMAARLGVRAIPAFADGDRLLAAGVQSVDRLQQLLGRRPQTWLV